MDYKKKQEEFYKSAIKKRKEIERVRALGNTRYYTKELIRAGVPEQNILTEVGSATESVNKRPVFYNLIENQLKEGDCLIITKIDRCSRNTLSFLQFRSQLSDKHVHFRVLELPEKYFKESPSDKFVSTALAAIAEVDVPTA